MEAVLLENYEINLKQAKAISCMESPLKESLGPCTIGGGVKELLLGIIQSLVGVSEATMEILKYVALKDITKPLSTPRSILKSE